MSCLLFINMNAQIPPVAGEVEKLKLTSNPAYVILGVEPTNIERPSTPREFITGVQAGIVNGKLKPNFAMEFNPFIWASNQDTSDRDAKWFKAANYIIDHNWYQNFKKSFGFSIATSATDTTIFGSLKAGTGLSFGLKANLLSFKHGEFANRYENWLEAFVKQFFYNQFMVNLIVDNNFSFTHANIDAYAINTALLINASILVPNYLKPKLILTLNDLVKNTKKQVSKGISLSYMINELTNINATMNTEAIAIQRQKIAYAKTGFSLDFAAAGMAVFQENNFSHAVFSKMGIWLTPSYRWDMSNNINHVQSIDALGVFRYTWNDKRVDSASYLDLGMKVQYNYDKLAVSAEGVLRFATPKPLNTKSAWTYRAVANIEYTLVENITLKLTVGTNFDGNTRTYTDPKQMIGLVGLDFGLLK